MAAVLALIAFLSTLQLDINGSTHPYATDVGEIQNALPRWGLIHRSGYPLYTALGSSFVAILRLVGVRPAAGASLFSALWGVVTVGLLVALAQELGAPGAAAVLGALFAALSTSMWVDASVAEVHTMTLAFSVATLLFAVRFGRTGRRCALLLLTFAFTQGVAHQRTVALLLPAVIILVWPQRRAVWRSIGYIIPVAVLAPLTYLYMPFRVWTGATWVFGSPGTWEGFWTMVFDNRAGRVVKWYGNLDEWLARLSFARQILSDDMLWPLLVLGLAVWVSWMRHRDGLAMTLAWIPSLLLVFVIWEDKISDALLASKLPVVLLAGVGLALFVAWLWKRWRMVGTAMMAALALVLAMWAWHMRPFVLSITRDPHAEMVIATAERLYPLPDDRITTLMVLWGHDYWALAYAQEFRGELPGLNLVDHNVNLRAVEKDGRLLTPSVTFHVLPLSWWEKRLGRVYLASAAPGIVEVDTTPPIDADTVPSDVNFDLGNGVVIRSATLGREATPGQLHLVIYWEAVQLVQDDYSVAVHLVAHDPPQGAHDVLDQADATHPVGNWYPTSLWSAGEIVRDDYVLEAPPGSSPVAMRVAMYRIDQNGAFANTAWLALPVPE